MTIVTAAELRAHSNLSDDDPDAFLEQKVAAAEEWCAAHLGQALDEFDPLPASVKEAVLRIAAELYENREASIAVNTTLLPFGVSDLLLPYRVWTF